MQINIPRVSLFSFFLAGISVAVCNEAISVHLPHWATCSTTLPNNLNVRSEYVPKEFSSYSRGNLDLFAYNHFFQNVRNGTYLELGARDGLWRSNTLALNRFASWHGVLIEASPIEFMKIRKNRPFDISVNAAVCEMKTTVHFLDNGGASSGIVEFMPPTYLHSFFKGQQERKTHSMAVSCIPLSDILEKVGITHFDLFSLDVECGEMNVLKSIDFTRFSAKVMVVETIYYDGKKYDELINFLARFGYLKYYTKETDTWFVNKEFNQKLATGLEH